MPNKKYYPGYANGSFVANKQRDPDFYKNLKKRGINPFIPGEDPDRTDRETYRLEHLMTPFKQEGIMKSAAPLYAIPAAWDALADMLPGTMPKGYPGSMYNEPVTVGWRNPFAGDEVVDLDFTPRSVQD